MKAFKVKEIYVRWIGIPIVSVLILPLVKDPSLNFWGSFFHSLIFTGVFWNGAVLIFFFYRKQFPKISQTPKRIILTIISLVTFIVLADPLICLTLGTMDINNLSWSVFFRHSDVDLFASGFIGTIYEASYFFEKWKDTFRQNEELRNQRIRTQFEVLQNQMSPHFLFNSLNTLTTLIAENQDLAIKFTEKLSEVYRYILQNKERELVSLEEELEFVNNYIYLFKIRFPENLHVTEEIDKKYYNLNIAPLTLQILVENAIKHNVVSKAHPLNIEIYIENGISIVVKNNLQLKETLEKSTKTGLQNISRRYQYLGNRKIDIITTAKNYMVAVPLISVFKESEFKMEAL